MNISTLCWFQTLIAYLTFFYSSFIYFFSPDGYSEDGCHVDTAKSNSEETVCRCNHLTYFAVLVDFDSDGTKVFFFFFNHRYFFNVLPPLGSIINFLFPIFDKALQEGRNDIGDYHVRRVKSFRHRNAFDNRPLFFPHVSTVTKQ